MNRASFERVIRSCCRHLDRDELVVIGSVDGAELEALGEHRRDGEQPAAGLAD